MIADIERARIAGKQVIAAQTAASYTVVGGDTGDRGKLVPLTHGSACTLIVPADAVDTGWGLGDYCDVQQAGAGQITVTAGAGVTLRVGNITAKTLAQYATVRVQKIAVDTWLVDGTTAAT
jgi:hypothetical protein